MATVRYDKRIPAGPDAVWEVVRDPVGVADWFPGIQSVRMLGSSRIVSVGRGVEVTEEIVTVDDDLRRFQYRICGGPIPVEFHLSTIDVIDVDAQSLVVYSCDVKPDELAAVMSTTLPAALDRLAARFA